MWAHEDRTTSFYGIKDRPALEATWGSLTRPIKVSPESVTIEYRRSNHPLNGHDWKLVAVFVCGDRIHPQANHSVLVRVVDGDRDTGVDMPDWIAELVRSSHPGVTAEVQS